MLQGHTDSTATNYDDAAAVVDSVKEYYGKVLHKTEDLKTTACTACGAPPLHVRQALRYVPAVVTEKFYGCGNPIPTGIEGLTVLDLGCGSGRDVFVAAQLVGPKGHCIGVDMTDEQLATARDAIPEFARLLRDAGLATQDGIAKIEFRQGYIEDLIHGSAKIAPNSVDLCISNCVINLSPAKDKVLAGVFEALRPGGEMYFSDVYCDRRLSEEARRHEVLFGECVAGALYINDFLSLAKRVGFADPRELSRSVIEVNFPGADKILGNAKFYSITYRLFKLPTLEPNCEDYGQVAVYLGTVPHYPLAYTLDRGHAFEKDRPVLVCGNTAAMLQDTWLKPHFRVFGNRQHHFGRFDCSKAVVASAASTSTSSGCGGGSSCGGGC